MNVFENFIIKLDPLLKNKKSTYHVLDRVHWNNSKTVEIKECAKYHA